MRRFAHVRGATEQLAAPLSAEDQQLQSMPDASPIKWHRGHTTWFFDTFVLGPRSGPVRPDYAAILNSYYEAVGPRHPRPARGLLSRPSAREIDDYRRAVDGRLLELIAGASDTDLDALVPLIELGLAHEEQHQELMLTDILHAFSQNPLLPRYREYAPSATSAPPPPAVEAAPFSAFEGGLVEVGAHGAAGFAFDNEQPRHRVWVEPFALAARLVTVSEVHAFIAEGGYRNPALWLSEGLDFVRANGIEAPLYARVEDGIYLVFGLDGLREAQGQEPAAHLSFYEADAIARFLGGELPTEHEWELVAARCPTQGNFRESGALRPLSARSGRWPDQLFGDVWEWTRSAYAPYPGYTPAAGALGEYNGKFMVSQMVLRGGSCFTPEGHVRASYRNFWPPHTRFQMAGLRVKKPLDRR